MAGAQAAAVRRDERIPAPVDGGFYTIANILDEKERAIVGRVRAFMDSEVASIIEDCWTKELRRKAVPCARTDRTKAQDGTLPRSLPSLVDEDESPSYPNSYCDYFRKPCRQSRRRGCVGS
jgi:hypothetical protein